MKDMDLALEVNNVTKIFDGFQLKNISINVPKGTIMGFVGQNGSGKTTTIKTLINIYQPDSGEIKLFGLDLKTHEKEIKERIAVIFDELPFSSSLTVSSLNIILKTMFKKWNSNLFYEYIKRFNLPTKKKIGTFSKGMKMKLQIAVGLSHEAELLIMDEATSGLDPVVRSEMLDIFLEYLQDETHSIFMSSHITSDLERIADSITFIHNGMIILSGDKNDILDNHRIIKCKKEDREKIAEEDIISVRNLEFGLDILVNNYPSIKNKYQDFDIEKSNLDEILLFYVKGKQNKEWSI